MMLHCSRPFIITRSVLFIFGEKRQCRLYSARELTADKVMIVYRGHPDEYFMKRAEAEKSSAACRLPSVVE
jgi:hypothetical protein